MSRVISADVPADLADRIEAAREQDESRSACVRRLVRDGLEAEQRSLRNLPTPRAIMAVGILMTLVAISPPEPLDFVIGVGAMIPLTIGIILELAHLMGVIR